MEMQLATDGAAATEVYIPLAGEPSDEKAHAEPPLSKTQLKKLRRREHAERAVNTRGMRPKPEQRRRARKTRDAKPPNAAEQAAPI